MASWQLDAHCLSDGLQSRKRRLPVLGFLFHERCCFGCNEGVAADPVGDWNDGDDGGRRATSPSSLDNHCAGAWSPLTTVAPSGCVSALLDAGLSEGRLLLYMAPRGIRFMWRFRYWKFLFYIKFFKKFFFFSFFFFLLISYRQMLNFCAIFPCSFLLRIFQHMNRFLDLGSCYTPAPPWRRHSISSLHF